MADMFVSRMENWAKRYGWEIKVCPASYPHGASVVFLTVYGRDAYAAMEKAARRMRGVHIEPGTIISPYCYEGYLKVMDIDDYNAWKIWDADRAERVEAFWTKLHEFMAAGYDRDTAVKMAEPYGVQD